MSSVCLCLYSSTKILLYRYLQFACVCFLQQNFCHTNFFSLPHFIFYIDNDPPDHNFSTARIISVTHTLYYVRFKFKWEQRQICYLVAPPSLGLPALKGFARLCVHVHTWGMPTLCHTTYILTFIFLLCTWICSVNLLCFLHEFSQLLVICKCIAFCATA